MANIIEKIIRNKTEEDFQVGDIINVKVDWAMAHDGTIVLTQKYFNKIATKVFDPDKIFVIFDHLYPPNSVNTANLLVDTRNFIQDQKITNFYEGGNGVCHQILLESEKVKKGDFLVGADSHSATAGAKTCLSMGVGATDMAYIFAKGQTWIKVPECFKIRLIGKLSEGVTFKDVFLQIARDLTVEGAAYKGIVYESQYELAIDEKAVFCNMGIEIGAKFSIFEDDIDGELRSDSDDDFKKVLVYDLGTIKSNIACPHDVDNVVEVNELQKTKVDVAYIGTCTGGRVLDFEQAASVLKNKHINDKVRLLLAPASKAILQKIMENGTLEILLEAGGVLLPVGCGPCLGGHLGVLAEGEVAVSTANRNFMGRMGSKSSFIYLGSPITVAKAALLGYIGGKQ